MKELILKIPIDEVEKIQYALNHVQLTGDEHIDSVLCRLNEVIAITYNEQLTALQVVRNVL